MVAKDITQMRRKLKHPQLRYWGHPMAGGDDFFYPAKWSEKNVENALKFKGGMYRGASMEKEPMVAVGGKEYGLREYLKRKRKK